MKKIFKTYYLAIISCLAVLSASAKDGVAVVIDAVSYEKARTELDGYVHALEKKQNYKVYIVVDKWQVPDSIRTRLISLHEKKRDAIVALCSLATYRYRWCVMHNILHQPSRWIRVETAVNHQCQAIDSMMISDLSSSR